MVKILCIHNQIQLEPEWISRELNEKADYLSRIVDHDDWLLNPIIFHSVDKAWWPHAIDWFAVFHNKQTPIGSTVDVGIQAQGQLMHLQLIGMVITTGGAHQSG